MADPTFPTDLPTDLSDRPPDRPGELQTRVSHPQIPADFGKPPANKNPSCHVKKLALCGDGGVSYIFLFNQRIIGISGYGRSDQVATFPTDIPDRNSRPTSPTDILDRHPRPTFPTFPTFPSYPTRLANQHTRAAAADTPPPNRRTDDLIRVLLYR